MVVAPALNVLRMPDSRFADLPGFPFQPRYFSLSEDRFGALRMHHIDAKSGSCRADAAWGPIWPFLYRKLIDRIAEAGYRAVASDQISFGRSHKLADRADYSYLSFADWMRQCVLGVALHRITLVCFARVAGAAGQPCAERGAGGDGVWWRRSTTTLTSGPSRQDQTENL